MTPQETKILEAIRLLVDALLLPPPIPQQPVFTLTLERTSMATATYKFTITGATPGAVHHFNVSIGGVAQPQKDVLDQDTIDFDQGAVLTGPSITDDIGGVLAPPAVIADFTVPTHPAGPVTPTVSLDFQKFNP